MEIKEAQNMMRRIYLERDSERGVDFALLRTFQELAELNYAILENEGESSVADELADVLAWTCSLANLLNIDLTQALYSKYSDVCSECGQSPCICP